MKQVSLVFILDEEVTPEIFAGKVALACGSGGALRLGESVSVANTRTVFTVGKRGADDVPWEDKGATYVTAVQGIRDDIRDAMSSLENGDVEGAKRALQSHWCGG